MSILISCQCGTKLKVQPTAAGKTVSCPKCKQLVKVPNAAAAGPAQAPARRPTTQRPAPQGASSAPAQAAPAAQAAATVTLTCQCGQQMKVASAHAGKTVACPKCQSRMVVPGGAAPVIKPVQPVTVQPIQPVAVQPSAIQPIQPAPQDALPDFFSAGAAPVGGLQPYTPPAAIPAARRKQKAGGPASKTGLLVALIGLCIMGGGLFLSGVGQASMHLLVYRATSASKINISFSMSHEERQAAFESAESRAATSRSLRNIMEIMLKIGRTVLLGGTITAIIGYGMCIMTPGAQMGLAIAALAVGAIGGILDLIMRVVPYLAENDLPRDIITIRGSVFNSFSSITLMPLLIEFLMAVHLILFSIFVLVGANRRKHATPAYSITSISLFGVYIGVIFIVNILMGNARGFSTSGTLWTAFGIHWVANICLAVGLGFLITAVVESRKA